MTRRPVPDRRNPLPWLALALIGLAWSWLLARSDGSAPVIAAPQRVVETVIVVQTPTYTPTPERTPTARTIVVTATPNASATATIPPCWEAKGGTVCVRYSKANPTPTALAWCSDVEDRGVAVLCRKSDDGTELNQETGE